VRFRWRSRRFQTFAAPSSTWPATFATEHASCAGPAFTLMAVLALGIGVGTNITIFLFVNQWLLRPIDARDPAR
jgi:hypothetical protein